MKKISPLSVADVFAFRKFFVVLLLALAFVYPARAATYTWNDDDSNDLWEDPGNYSPNPTPNYLGTYYIGTAGDIYNMTASGTDGAIGVTFSDTAGVINVGNASVTYNIGQGDGGTLTLDNSGAGASINELSTALGDTITAPIIMADTNATTALTITSAAVGHTFTISGGITSTQTSGSNLVLAANGTGAITLNSAVVNNSGTITNSGSSTGTVTIGGSGGGVGSNVTAINQNSAGSALTISGALAVNNSGTTVNSNGAALTTISGGVTGGTGSSNLTLNANSTGSITLSTTSVNNSGSVINSGTGTGTTTISTTIGSSVTGVTENSAGGSTLSLTSASANTFTGTISVLGGTLLFTNNGDLGTSSNGIQLGNSSGTLNSTIQSNSGTAFVWNAGHAITVESGNTGTATIGENAAGAYTIAGNITLGSSTVGHGVTLQGLASSTEIFSGNITDGGSVTSGFGVVTISTTGATIELSGANTFAGGVNLAAGNLSINSSNNEALGTGTLVINGGNFNQLTASGNLTSGNNAQVWDQDFSYTGSGFADNLGTGAVNLGALTNNAGGGTTAPDASRTVTVNSGGTLTVGGIISNGTNGLTTGLTKAGPGILILNGNDTYTGGTIVNGGILQLGGTQASTVTLNSAGSLNAAVGTVATLLGSGTITSGSTGDIALTGGTDTETLSFTGYNSLMLGASTASTFTGTLTPAGTTYHLGGGGSTLTLSNLNALSSTNSLVVGALTLLNSSTVLTAGASTGIVQLTNANSMSGTTTVNAGTLNLSASSSNTFGGLASSAVTVTNGAILAIDSATATLDPGTHTRASSVTLAAGTLTDTGTTVSTNVDLITGALTLSTGANTITIIPATGVDTGLNAGSLAQTSGNGYALVNGTKLGAAAFPSNTGGGNIIFATAPTASFVGSTTQTTGGINASQKNTAIIPYLVGEATVGTGGTGTVTGIPDTFVTYDTTTGLRPLNPTDEFTQNAITAGTNTRITAATSTVVGTTSINSLILQGATTSYNLNVIAGGSTLTDASGAILATSGASSASTSVSIAAGDGSSTLAFGSNQAVITVNPNAGAGFTNTLTIAPIITGSGGLVKLGGGVLSLSGANTYTGTTAILAGTLSVGNASGLGASGSSVLLGDTAGGNNATLSSAGVNVTRNIIVQGGNTGTATLTNNTGSMTYSGTITLGSNGTAHGVTLGSSSGINTFSGVIADPAGVASNGGIVTIGFGNVYLPTANTFTGGVSLNGGVLIIGNNTALGTGTFTLNGGSLSGNNNASLANPILFNANVSFGNNNLSGNGTNITFTGATTLTGSRVISLQIIGFTMSGVIADSVPGSNYSLTYNGSTGGFGSNLTLSGANTFDGGLILNPQGAGTSIFNIGNLGTSSAGSAFGTGTLTINSGLGTLSLSNTSGASGTVSTNNAEVWNGDFTYSTGNLLDMGTGAVSLGTSAIATRTVTVSSAADTFETDGVISNGTNAVTPTTGITKAGTGTLALGGTSTYTGATVVNAGTLSLPDITGAIGSSAITLNSGTTLAIANAGGTPSASLTRALSVTMNGATLTVTGASAGNSDDVITNALTISTGTAYSSVITVTPNAAKGAELSAGSLARNSGGVALVNGANLGKAAVGTAADGNIIFTTAPTAAFVGSTTQTSGGINSGQKNTAIIPYLVGEATSTTGGAGTATGTADTFLTYDSTTGLRPLNPTDEFTQNAITSGTDTRITSATTSSSTASINSLLMATSPAANLTIADGTTLTDASGALLFVNTGFIAPLFSTGTLGFGTAEGVVYVDSTQYGIINAVVTGSGGLTKAGAGALDLTNASTNVSGGAVTVDAGALVLGGNDTYAGTTAIVAGATLQIGNGGTTGSIANSVGASLAVPTGSTFAVDLSSNVTLGASLIGNSGIVSGAGGFTQVGTGTLTINTAQTYTGATSIIGGGTLDLAGTTGSLNGVATGTALTFNNVGGTFIYDNSAQTTGADTQKMSTLNETAGEDVVVSTYGSGGTDVLTIASVSRTAGAVLNFVTNGASNSNGVNNKIAITQFTSGTTTPTGTLLSRAAFFDGASYATYDAGGFVRAFNYSSDTGADISAGGTILSGSPTTASQVEMNGNITAQTTATLGTLFINGSYTLTMASAQTLTVPGILVSGGNTATIAAGTLSNGNGEMIIQTAASNDSLTISSALSGTSGTDKSGAGTLTLTGTNGAIGGFTLDAGTLDLNSAGALGSTAASTFVIDGLGATIDNTSAAAITLSTNHTQTWNSDFTFGGAGFSLNLGTGAVSLGTSDESSRVVTVNGTVGGSGTTSTGILTVGGVISSGTNAVLPTLGLTKAGTGELALTGANTFIGPVAINNGTLAVSTVGTGATAQGLGEGSIVTLGVAGTSSGTLLYNGTSATPVTLDKNITALGNGGDTIQNGDVTAGTGSLTLSGTLTKNQTKLTLNGGTKGIVVSGQITGGTAANFTSDLNIVVGPTTLSNANNNYTGPTNVYNGGTLLDGIANAMPTGTVLTLGNAGDSGALTNTFALNGFNQSIAALDSATDGNVGYSDIVTNGVVGTNTLTLTGLNSDNAAVSSAFGGVIQNGASGTTALTISGGTHTLSGVNTYTGATQVNAGVLEVDSPGSLASGTTVTVGGSTASGTPTLQGTGTVHGNVIVASAGGGAAGTITPGTAGSPYGTLSVGGTINFQVGSDFAINMSAGSTGELVITGAATIGSGADITINLGSALTNSSYTLATAASGLSSGTPFTVLGSLPAGYALVYTGTALDLNQVITVTDGQYTLTTTPTSLNVHANGGTTALSTTIHNSGTGTQDALNYGSLTATGTGVGAVSGTTSGSNLAQGQTGGPAANTFTAGATAGNVSISNSATVTNVTAAGTPVGTNNGATINVYSGTSTWNTNGGGSWGTLASNFGANWGTNQGSPGLDGSFTNTDTATFDNTVLTAGNSATVTLDGANPSLKAITFNTAGGGYTLAPGSGGSIALSGNGGNATVTNSGSGSSADTISAAVSLTSSVDVNVAAGQSVNFSGAVTGGGGLNVVTGAGTTILSNAAGNGYTGGTTISNGKLYVNNTSNSGTGTGNVTVQSGGTLAGSGTITPTGGASVTVLSGATLASGGVQTSDATHDVVTGTGMTLNSNLAVNGGGNLTFALGAGASTGAFNFASPNLNSTYLTATGTVAFGTTGAAVNIKLVDLTAFSSTDTLQLRYQNPYLLISAGGSDSNYDLVTSGGYDQNGYVLGIGSSGTGTEILNTFSLSATDINGGVLSAPYNNLQLYLYDGDLEVVPEPGTWALMLGGLALLVFIQQRRPRSSRA